MMRVALLLSMAYPAAIAKNEHKNMILGIAEKMMGGLHILLLNADTGEVLDTTKLHMPPISPHSLWADWSTSGRDIGVDPSSHRMFFISQNYTEGPKATGKPHTLTLTLTPTLNYNPNPSPKP